MRRRASRAVGPLLTLAVTACGGRQADFYVHGAEVVVATDAPFAHQAGFPARFEDVASVALTYWGGDWSALQGRTITFSSGAVVPCEGVASASGCFDGDVWVSDTDPGVGEVSCVEQTVLVHEIGHAVLGDPLHEDPRWMELDPVGEALAGRVGYTPGGTVDCVISVSVWRHPLGTR